ncbi:hypothetical protein COR50_07245 [Chitinophaga caeni]|uniref:Uncharacterized protein n=1 Tax=Chitinophaga caeni TaxID=2029983 RepID=A0A291QSS4_9BACT|nr:hypothetical protein [Chitinophaga caeni]ATL46995.1 hypothetical protein COR50_07245 [Chitinophaga caeni]
MNTMHQRSVNINVLKLLNDELHSLQDIFQEQVCEMLNLSPEALAQKLENEAICFNLAEQQALAAIFNDLADNLSKYNADYMLEDYIQDAVVA